MSNSCPINPPVPGSPNSTEDPKIATALTNLVSWLANPGIAATDLVTNAVTTDKITDLNVTTAKLADLSVTTGKLAESTSVLDGVTTSKIAPVTIARPNIRLFTVPKLVTTLPQIITAATGSTTSGVNTLTAVSVTAPSGGVFSTGQLISCANFPSDTVITAISGSTLTLNRNATATGTSVAVTASPQDGDEVYYSYPGMFDINAPWHLRYNATLGSTVQRWQVVAATPISFADGGSTVVAGTSNTYVNGTIDYSGPLPPVWADYNVSISARAQVTACTATQSVRTSFCQTGGTTPTVSTDANSVTHIFASSSTPLYTNSNYAVFAANFDNRAGGGLLRMQHATSVATSAISVTFTQRYLTLTPLRIANA